jgi:hypothetical protein
MSDESVIVERLDRIESLLFKLVLHRAVKDWYSTDELAQIVGKAEYTCREWCRSGRIRAERRQSGRGAHSSWMISHEELFRYQKEGLLPPTKI